ncbi:hypothetical protein FXO37_15436 [Capsicum annuum]|nr:hypothetical protein FXO37_15436 [Capsicum annuum]
MICRNISISMLADSLEWQELLISMGSVEYSGGITEVAQATRCSDDLSEWLELKKQLIFTDRDSVSHVDLIAKVHGLQKAASYIEKLPKSFRSEVVYQSLLGHCASKGYTKKAEEIFNKMRDLGFPVTSFACSHLLNLYK